MSAVGDDSLDLGLLERVKSGDRQALDELLAKHRDRMRRFLDLRLDGAMRARVDVSDVIQEAQLEMARRIDDYLERRPMPFHVWVHQTTYEHLLRLRRQHVEAACRAVGREKALPDHSSIMLAERVVGGGGKSPLQKLVQAELVRRVHEALDGLNEVDREVLLLRIFEEMSNQEAAQVLGLEAEAARKRYARALVRLQQVLAGGDSPSQV